MRQLTPEVADELLGLMQGKRVSTQINTEVIYPRISDGPDAVFSFLLLAGYLTPKVICRKPKWEHMRICASRTGRSNEYIIPRFFPV